MSVDYKRYKNGEAMKKLERKGFINTHTKGKFFMAFYYNGRKTRAHTILNLRPNKIIGKGLFNKISSDLFLNKKELIDLLDCPMSENDYLHTLIERDAITNV